MFFDNVSGLARVLVVGPLAYVWLIAVLRFSGKRTLAQLNAFDFIVTVALGSTLATVALSSSVAWSEGALALGLLAALQFVVAWSSVHVPWVRGAVTSAPTVLLRDGQPDRAALARQRITEESLWQAVRSAGIGGWSWFPRWSWSATAPSVSSPPANMAAGQPSQGWWHVPSRPVPLHGLRCWDGALHNDLACQYSRHVQDPVVADSHDRGGGCAVARVGVA